MWALTLVTEFAQAPLQPPSFIDPFAKNFMAFRVPFYTHIPEKGTPI
jgi:hypothetical protein